MVQSRRCRFITVRLAAFLIVLSVLMFSGPGTMMAGDYSNNTEEKLDFEGNTVHALQDDWLFFWEELLMPEEVKERIGHAEHLDTWGYWTDTGNYSSKGYATYFKEIRIPEEAVGKSLGLYIPDITASYVLWINGDLIHKQGNVGSEAEEVPWIAPAMIQYTAKSTTLEMVIQVSNFHHREGGPHNAIEFGLYEDVRTVQQASLYIEIMMIGALMLAAVHHFIIFLLRRKDRANLYFSLFCVMIAVRVSLTGERMLYQLFPHFSWELGIHLEYVSFYAGGGIFLLFLYHMYKVYGSGRVTYTLAGISGLFALFVILTPVSVFSESLPYYQMYTGALFLYGFMIIIKAALDRKQGAGMTLALFGVFAVTVVNDMLHHLRLVDSVDMAPVGLLFMIFGQVAIISMRTFSAYEEIEQLSEEQQKWQEHLEDEVARRTEELNDTMKHLKTLSELDGLTGLPNRRMFDEDLITVVKETMDENGKLGLVMLDIDNYKNYNDFYGHLQGDDCLKEVATLFKQVIKEEDSAEVYRYGGEEFAVLVKEASEAETYALAEQIRKRVEEAAIPHEQSDVQNRLTVSAGVAVLQARDLHSPEKLLEQADAALYQAKRSGKNTVKTSRS
ncbi:GGDEF domain-containing protein [Salisediminibacterium selenitireducens]|uniref:7TM domain sensor diguanylate cyclase n=1 Tax=Bacillus selenitireducens (strain ATCC 700615 / DSM 15326 / MLS10) TaxID=439292 RepID=D6Y1I4_BACIE|nr:diguanylate cyclase [Salisediminibacterium selenitireducens]ADI00771.1 7TM domain sensor diguanylate cyclase [[Bacillus] selenitireducens MLS10]